jgi:hypothetical protein
MGTDLKLQDAVTIVALKTIGRVISILEDSSGFQFNVRYFWNGEAKSVYFFSDELAKIEDREDRQPCGVKLNV